MSKLKIYRASAGSGKTFKLTEEYLKLLFINPGNYRHILAVTFTNKSTGEMKRRIVSELCSLSRGDDSPYLPVLSENNLTKEDVRKTARDALEKILNDYSRFSVETIDNFFQRIIRGFIKELGIRGGFRVELDTGKVLTDIIREVLIDIENREELKTWLAEFADERIREGNTWNFSREIRHLANEIFKESFQGFGMDVHQKYADKQFLNKFKSKLFAIKAAFENQMAETGEKALSVMKKHGLSVNDFSHKASGVAGYFLKLADKTNFEPGKRAYNAQNNEDAWFPKDSPKKADVKAAFHDGLNTLLVSAANHYEKHAPDYHTAKSMLRFFNVLGILTDIQEKLRDYTEEKNIFLITEAPKLIHSIIAGNETPFIYEKTGNTYHHFMIDEFQDTSVMQWSNFKPLVAESLAKNNTGLVVGDVKQSIYRWRNSNWKLLAETVYKDFQNQGIEETALQTNWRSSEEIISFNNAFFSTASGLIKHQFLMNVDSAYKDKDFITALAAKISNAYADAPQTFPPGKKPQQGYVFSAMLADDEDTSWKMKALEKMAAIIEQLQDKNYQPEDIAILVRKKEEGKEITDFLTSLKTHKPGKYKYDVISNEALFLYRIPSVRIIINCMKLLVNPEDDIAAAVIKNEHTCYLHQENMEMHQVLCGEKVSTDLLFQWYDSIKQLPLYEQAEMLIQLYGLQLYAEELPYINAFLDILADYSISNPPDTSSFLEWWEEEHEKKAITVPEQQNAMQLFTIHKAKGLEYRAVIIPFCNFSMSHQSNPPILWCQADKAPFNEISRIPVKYEKGLAQTIFFKDYYTEMLNAYIDNLNLLYVAFTRAKTALFVLGKDSRKSTESITTGADLIQHVFNAFEDMQDQAFSQCRNPEKQEFVYGELQDLQKSPGKAGIVVKLSGDAYQPFKDRIHIKKVPKHLIPAGGSAAIEASRHGMLMHKLFSLMDTVEDIDKALNALMYEGLIAVEERNSLKKEMNTYFSDEQVKTWFRQEWKIKKEPGILLENGQYKRPDRVLIKGNNAVVIDYKFTAQQQESHKQQIREYKSYLEKMGYSDVQGYLWYVLLNKKEAI